MSEIMTAEDAAQLVPDGANVGIVGAGGGLIEPDALLAAIEARFRDHGHPTGLTLLHSQGLGDSKTRGLNHLAHAGLVSRVVGAHWSWSPSMQALAREEKIAAYALPGGTIQHLIRESGARRPGLFTHIGLDTFVDPRLGGGRMNARAAAPLSEIVTIDGEPFIRYFPVRLDVAVVRGTVADARGNVSFDGEGAELDALVLAVAARNAGGKVLVQVREIVAEGSLPARSVRLPAALTDAIVVVPEQRWSYSGEPEDIVVTAEDAAPERRIIAARAYRELRAGMVASFGFGIPDGVAHAARESGLLRHLYTTLDHGHHGGHALQGPLFGFVPDGEAMIDSPTQFDFYSGGGIDMAFLGFGEADGQGSVNVSKLGGKVIGPGGFIDIAQGAKSVVFCGTFEAKGLRVIARDGTLQIDTPGAIAKFVTAIEQISFSGPRAGREQQSIMFVTERAVFRLRPEGLSLDEIAPGIDLEIDVLARMGFTPLIAPEGPAMMPADCFA